MVKLTGCASLDKGQGRKFNGSSYILLFVIIIVQLTKLSSPILLFLQAISGTKLLKQLNFQQILIETGQKVLTQAVVEEE